MGKYGMKIANSLIMKLIKKMFARYLRRNQTGCEKIMWKLLRNRRFLKYKFRRQHVIDGFIVDFYCHNLKLVLEIDGWIHNNQKDYDRARENILIAKGYKIIRINNDAIVSDLDSVLQKLEKALSLCPSPGGRG